MNLARLAMTMVLCCCALLGMALLLGKFLPAPADRSILNRNPCALPCLFGVTPGATSRAQAVDVLARDRYVTQINRSLLNFSILDYEGDAALASVGSAASGQIESVHLKPGSSKTNIARLSDLLLAGLTPTHVYRGCTNSQNVTLLITFGARDEVKVVVVTKDTITPYTPVASLDAAAPGWRTTQNNVFSPGCVVKLEWIGFAPLWKYNV